MEINTIRLEVWVIQCPSCKNKDYVTDKEIAFNPNDDKTHIVSCMKCGVEFEIETG